MISRFATLTASIALCGMLGAASLSHAGVMPDNSGHTPQKEHVSTLDEALMEIQGKTTEAPEDMAAPVSLTEQPVEPVSAEPPKMDPIAEQQPVEPVAKPEPEPQQAETPKTVFDPVPESRFVQTQPNSSFFGLSVGLYDAFSRDQTAAAFNLEWQPGVKIAGFIQPIFGAMITTQGSMMGYGGAGIPFNITENVILMPSAAVGLASIISAQLPGQAASLASPATQPPSFMSFLPLKEFKLPGEGSVKSTGSPSSSVRVPPDRLSADCEINRLQNEAENKVDFLYNNEEKQLYQ